MKTKSQNRIIKVCPVVLRCNGTARELLLFEHPLAGVQIVKGTVEVSDLSFEAAAIRELKEESGINDVITTQYLGHWESGYQNQWWHFVRCETQDKQPESWCFNTQDDGGHTFKFFWHNLKDAQGFKCHRVFKDAILTIEKLCRS